MSKLGEQFKELKDKGSKGFLNLNSKQTKIVTWGAYIIMAMLLITVATNTLLNSVSTTPEQNSLPLSNEPPSIAKSETDIGLAEQELESRLERILSEIQGAGKVSINLNLISGPTYEYATNVMTNSRVTEESVNGGNRIINENNEEGSLVVTRGSNNSELPVIIRESKPQVQGVLVVAEGATDPRIKMELSRAVETVLGIGNHQVHVVPKGR
ncbi:MAG: hypothetical protein SCK28_10460 [Bacillota bacterium]|nr:hypothetical protein [Bacillota bacterium]